MPVTDTKYTEWTISIYTKKIQNKTIKNIEQILQQKRWTMMCTILTIKAQELNKFLNRTVNQNEHNVGYQSTGWWKAIFPSRHPDTTILCTGENWVATTMFTWPREHVDSYSFTGDWGTLSHNSLHWGSKEKSLIPNPNGELMSLPSPLKATSLMNPRPTLHSSMYPSSRFSFVWMFFFSCEFSASVRVSR